MNDLNNLLTINNCDTIKFMKLTHQTLLQFILESICHKINSDPQSRKKVFTKYYQSRNDCTVAQKIAYEICGIKLPPKDLLWLNKCILANLKKREKRKLISLQEKKDLLDKQNYKCACCNKDITLNNSHYDHIVPWNLVGDELEDNYQMLCTYCNEHKNSSIYYMFKRQIIKNNI